MASPLATLKDKFGDKAKLVAELEKLTKDEDLWVNRVNKNKGLAHVSNAKLLKLSATFAAVKEKFGTRAKMIDAILEIEKRKDEGFKTRLSAYPVPRLWDMYKAAAKRAGVAAKAADGTRAKRGPKKVATAKVAAAPKQSANVVASAKAKAKKNNKR